MLVTDLAMREMDREAIALFGWIPAVRHRLRRCFPQARWQMGSFRSPHQPLRSAQIPAPALPVQVLPMNPPIEETALPADSSDRPDTEFRWRRHPQLRNRPVSGPGDMSSASGRSFAARAILLAQRDRLDDARAAFRIAARDERIDLTTIPGFWNLSRAAMLVAATAYEDVERFRDAAALEATIRTTYRPQLVPPMVSTTRARRKAVGSGD